MLDSPFRAPLRTREKDLPRYGAQYRQDALWEGGNEALPPRWWQYTVWDETIQYQDDTLAMTTRNRPLPGVRLDEPWQLIVPGYEWHISPLGQSYFVNHNTRTTSWEKPTPERPAGSLTPECVIEGHSKSIWSLTCLGTSCNIMSASDDGSIRQWTRDGEPVGKPLGSHGAQMCSMAVSPDETMVVCGSPDGTLRLWDIKEGTMIGDPWKGHNAAVSCVDWSPNAMQIASGSEDGTIRRWNPNTGRQIATPIKTGHGWVLAVRYSPRCDKFASGGEDKFNMICVWSNDGELLIQIKGHWHGVTSLCWSKDSAYILSASSDSTIRKWQSIDGEELVVFRAHALGASSLCLSPDECHLVSAARDCSVRIWDLETNQPVGDPLLHDNELLAVVMSPDGKHIVSAGKDAKVYIWSLEAALKQQGNNKRDTKIKRRAVQSRDAHQSVQQPNNRGLARYGDDFWGNDTIITPRHPVPAANPSSAFRWRNLLGSLHVSTRPVNVPQSIPLEPRRWNFNLFPVGISSRIVDVSPARDEDRYGITPETDAEAAAAMQRTSGNEASSSTQPGHPAPGIQISQEQPTDIDGPNTGTGEVSYEVRCCGLFFSCGRSTLHQS